MILLVCFLVPVLPDLIAQEDEDIRSIVRFMSCDVEDLTDEDIERFSDLLRHPVRINVVKAPELISTGIFTRYQAASLIDYRSRSGQILSLMELASLDGFGDDFVERISPFITLEHYPEYAGKSDNEITARASYRASDSNNRYGYAARYKFRYGEALSASFALSRSLDSGSARPDAVCGSVEGRFRSIPLRFVVGDFNARFGQGLSMWSGVSFTSNTSPSNYMRKASGVTASSSFTGSNVLTGFAAEYSIRHYSLSIMLSAPDIKKNSLESGNMNLMPALNFTWLWRNGQAGLSHCLEFRGLGSGHAAYIPAMKTSMDASACLSGVDLFSEFVYDWLSRKISVLGGTVFPVGEHLDLAALLKTTPDEYAVSVSGSVERCRIVNGNLSAEMILYPVPKVATQDRSLQVKIYSQWQFTLAESLRMTFRLTERLRSWGLLSRTDVRTDVSWSSGCFLVNARLNGLKCRNVSGLCYVEGGVRMSDISVYLRQGLFLIDSWDDRIYVYERDAPGCYNAPAFYGRGVWVSLMTSWKPSRWCRLYLRCGYTCYPFMKETKPGKAELRLQSVFDF